MRIKGYSPLQLFNIGLYRSLYMVLLKYESHKRFYSDEKAYSSIKVNKLPYQELFTSIDRDTVIQEANSLLAGYLKIFGIEIPFNPKTDWLKCPITGSFWNKDLFFANAPYVQKGCHDVKYILEINKLNHLVVLAQGYYVTEDERYLECLKQHLEGWLACVPFEKSVANRIIMDLAFRCINLLQVMSICQDNNYFREKIQPKIIDVLIKHERQMRLFSTPRWFKTGNGDNHVTGEMVGLLCTQIWLKQITGIDYSKYFKQEIKYLVEILDKTIAPSGAYLEESDNYTRVVSEFLVFLDMTLKAFDSEKRHFKAYLNKKYLERLLCYLKNLSYHDMLPCVGDNDNARVLVAMNNNYGVDYVTDYLSKLEVSPADKYEYKDTGHYCLRSHDDNDVYAFIRAGQFSIFREGAGTHAHNDLLSVVLFADGSPIIVDKGCSFYNMGKQLRDECKSTKSHNVPCVNDLEMADITARGYINYPSCTGESTCGTSHFAFDGVLTFKDVKINRSIRYSDSTFSIKDIVSADSSYHGTITFLLAKDIIPRVLNDTSIELTCGKKKSLLSFEGISNMIVKDDRYFPRFAEEYKTKSIVIKYQTCNTIITTIKFNI